MKKLLVLFCVMTVSFHLFADNDKPIDVEQLPAPAKEFINQYFKDTKVSLATVDKELFETTYKLFLVNGSKIEFDKNGHWKEIDCQHTRVPEGSIPESIRNYIGKSYPEHYVTDIERDTHDYEIKLNNGLELKFDLKFRLIEIDD